MSEVSNSEIYFTQLISECHCKPNHHAEYSTITIPELKTRTHSNADAIESHEIIMEDNFYQFGTFFLDSKYKIVIDISTSLVFGVVHK